MSLHNAPPVNYPLGRSRFLALCLSLAWLLTAAVTAAWWLGTVAGNLRPLAGVASLAVSAWALRMGWQRAPAGQLQWDGQHWYWQSLAYPSRIPVAAPGVALDIQHALLLRLRQPAGPGWWLWAERGRAPARWLDLRRAVHAPHRPDRMAQPPPAEAP